MRGFSLPALAVFVAAGFLAGPAGADQEFDLTVDHGTVKVTVKPGWHINQEYPWKLVMGDKKIDKSEFKLAEKSASVKAPAGSGTLKGAVCFGEAQCVPFQKPVTVP